MRPRYDPRIAEIAPLAEIVIANEGEAAALLGDDDIPARATDRYGRSGVVM